MDVLLASNNAHKLSEFRQILADLPLTLYAPADLGLQLDPAETGTTFAANARIKAEAFAAAGNLITLADDSGLEVDALAGAPGVYSARYGKTAKDDHIGRYERVLRELAALNLSDAERTARFRCVIAIAIPGQETLFCQGALEGRIAHAPRGNFGFGYDPIFFVPEYNKTLAQLPPEEKNKISHRGRAAQAARPLLQNLLKG